MSSDLHAHELGHSQMECRGSQGNLLETSNALELLKSNVLTDVLQQAYHVNAVHPFRSSLIADVRDGYMCLQFIKTLHIIERTKDSEVRHYRDGIRIELYTMRRMEKV
jgi:hypothetical protein